MCMKTAFSCTLNAIIRGGRILWSGIYTNPLPPFFPFYSNPWGGGVWALLPLSKTCQWQWCSQDLSMGGQSEGTKRPSGGRVWEIFWLFCVYENSIFLHIKCYYLGGRLCEVAFFLYQSPIPPFFLFSPPTVRRFFWKFVYKNSILLHSKCHY